MKKNLCEYDLGNLNDKDYRTNLKKKLGIKPKNFEQEDNYNYFEQKRKEKEKEKENNNYNEHWMSQKESITNTHYSQDSIEIKASPKKDISEKIKFNQNQNTYQNENINNDYNNLQTGVDLEKFGYQIPLWEAAKSNAWEFEISPILKQDNYRSFL